MFGRKSKPKNSKTKNKVEIIHGISELVWDIVRTVKRNTLFEIKSHHGDVTYNNGSITLIRNDTTKETCKQLVAFANAVKNSEVQEISLEKTFLTIDKVRHVLQWCNEIQSKLKTSCVYIPDRSKVIAYCESYDDIEKVKHQFLLKQGLVKITERHSRSFPEQCTDSFLYDSSNSCVNQRKGDDYETIWPRTIASTSFPVLTKQDESYIFCISGSLGQQVVLKHGNIFDTRAVAIVSVEDECGTGTGRIASAIRDQIKDLRAKYDKDKRRAFQKKKEIGDVVITNGGPKGYRSILHAVLPYKVTKKPDKERKELISKMYANILDAATTDDIKSIVLTLIGAGLGSKRETEISTEAFLESYIEFCIGKAQKHSAKPLTVHFVCHKDVKHTDQLSVVLSILQKYVDSVVMPPSSPPLLDDYMHNLQPNQSLTQSQCTQSQDGLPTQSDCPDSIRTVQLPNHAEYELSSDAPASISASDKFSGSIQITEAVTQSQHSSSSSSSSETSDEENKR